MHAEKVVMVISQFYPLLGGAEVQARRLAAALRDRGVNLLILTRRLKGVPAYEVIDGIPVYRSIRTVNAPFLFGLLYVMSVAWFLYRKRSDYSIIHCHILQEYQTVVGIIIKMLFKKKMVAKMSSSGITSDLKLMKKTLAGKLCLLLLGRVDRIISLCSQSTAELLDEGIPAHRLQQISNGIDTRMFAVRVTRRQREKTITFIGRLDKFKGVDCLIEAFGSIGDGRPDLWLKIVGDGPDAFALQQQAKALRTRGRVVFKGQQEDIVRELSETDIFVLPSRAEGMSNVLLEAMACGIPVIATAVGGALDMICNRINGMLVPPGDAEAIRKALMQLIENEALADRLGMAARKTVEQRYDLARTADRYHQLYLQLLAGTSRQPHAR